ncbi:uncharacterized protein Hap1MRO34_009910 [Clarias gariepinus]|uniref:uncharacterized protein LOC128517009 n=1 Tax=Clarias gariepinus TaxID=13013 RepID=UPI00234DBCC1|nr:uncharacterized protein LOC128517009 [Clarias gariepinus]
MRLCTAVILILALCQAGSSDRLKVFGNLHETSSLPCPKMCSGQLTWTRFQKQDDVLVRCTRDSCWSKDGFSLPLEQFLSGDSTLTVLRADYSLRGLYMAECDSETVCEVVFTLSPVEMRRVISPGEPIDVPLPLTDMVGVNFNARDTVKPSSLRICTVNNERTRCSPDYEERTSRLNTLQIQGGNSSDSGIYTVQDLVNDETLAIIHVSVKGSKADEQRSGAAPVSQNHNVRRRSVHSEEKQCPDIEQERSMTPWVIALVILLILSVLMNFYLWNKKIDL